MKSPVRNIYDTIQEDLGTEYWKRKLENQVMDLCEELNIVYLKINKKTEKERRKLLEKIKKRSDKNG